MITIVVGHVETAVRLLLPKQRPDLSLCPFNEITRNMTSLGNSQKGEASTIPQGSFFCFSSFVAVAVAVFVVVVVEGESIARTSPSTTTRGVSK